MRRNHNRARLCCLLAIFLFLCAGRFDAARGAPMYPVKKSANGRYLVDQKNVPFLLTGDSPQSLIVNLSEAEAETYFANRSAHGFNAVWINLLCSVYTGGRPDGRTWDGVLPFTSTLPGTALYDLAWPNEAYFAHVDRILRLAAQSGLQVLLDPIETGDWVPTMLANGPSACRNYGRYLGSRYKSFDNIVWMSGNDFQDWRDADADGVVREVALGILDNDSRHLHTIELDFLISSSLDNTRWASILGLNATYTYFPTYARLRADYNRPNFLPNFLVEANYEFEGLQGPVTTAPILRKQEYWTMTSGATGQLYGNAYTWSFRAGWQDNLDTPGAIQIGVLKTFFESRAWYHLVPDTSHVVVTSGYGEFSSIGFVADNDYLTAARTPDGRLVVVYTPILRTFTVDMSKLSAPAITRWFDPCRGSYMPVVDSPLPNVGTRDFTPPGNNSDGDGDWVLVLEASGGSDPAEALTLSARPNPFRAGTSISFTLSAPADVILRLYDASGRLVRTLTHGTLPDGPQTIEWDGADADGRATPAGRYYLQFQAGSVDKTISIAKFR